MGIWCDLSEFVPTVQVKWSTCPPTFQLKLIHWEYRGKPADPWRVWRPSYPFPGDQGHIYRDLQRTMLQQMTIAPYGSRIHMLLMGKLTPTGDGKNATYTVSNYTTKTPSTKRKNYFQIRFIRAFINQWLNNVLWNTGEIHMDEMVLHVQFQFVFMLMTRLKGWLCQLVHHFGPGWNMSSDGGSIQILHLSKIPHGKNTLLQKQVLHWKGYLSQMSPVTAIYDIIRSLWLVH